MKKIVIIFVILTLNLSLLTFNCFAQPNGGFENWTPEANYENPDGWQTPNFLSLLTPHNPLSVFKVIGLDKHSGNFALKLKTIFVINNPSPSIIADSTGGIFTGKINVSPFSYRYGFPYAERPEKLEFWYKYVPVGDDTAEVAVILKKWNGSGSDTVGGGRVNIYAASGYTLFQINIGYLLAAIPDSAAIFFASSKGHVINSARVGSTLYIDDVLFTGGLGIAEKNRYADKVKVFPNPTKGVLNLDIQIEEAYNVRLLDPSGKLAGLYKIQNNKVIVNTSLFAAGNYFYDILDKKNSVLTSGKFNVIR